MTRRCHAMPFGAALQDDGRTRFRLWAPAAREVVLELGRGTRSVALVGENGWFEAVVDDAPAGTRYAYRIDGRDPLPDPASRWNPDDVHAPSMVVDPRAYAWQDATWRGRPWHEAVLYELHVGTFTPAGTFRGAIERLEHLVELGVTAVELMPVADFAGRRNWGYDGVLLFAPDASYGTPDDLKRFVDAAHACGLMVLLDVVYNHFGPEGNYLHQIAPAFFNPAHRTPWGAAINFDGPHNRVVRDFYIHNALYWLEEFHLDGLRFDAVHAIVDTSTPHIVAELTATVRRVLPRPHVHLVLENDANDARLLERDARGIPVHATAQWDDDVHHALHVIVSGETDGYYRDYAHEPLAKLGRALAEGFVHQGEWSAYRGRARGETSSQLPPLAFVTFLQNHDQVGNRPFGDRLAASVDHARLRAAVACLLLAPSPPMLFMGEEFAASTPFLFFCDFGAELAAAVTSGRREEFGRFGRFADAGTRAAIPDPNAMETFAASRLRWDELRAPGHAEWLAFYRECLRTRHAALEPRLAALHGHAGRFQVAGSVLTVAWTLGDAGHWRLDANLADAPAAPPVGMPVATYATHPQDCADRLLSPWSVRFGFVARQVS